MADLTEAIEAAAAQQYYQGVATTSASPREVWTWVNANRADLLDEYRADAREIVMAIAPIIERQARAAAAEEIAQAIENSRSHPEHKPTCQSCIVEAVHIERHAAIARGYTQPAETPGQDS